MQRSGAEISATRHGSSRCGGPGNNGGGAGNNPNQPQGGGNQQGGLQQNPKQLHDGNGQYYVTARQQNPSRGSYHVFTASTSKRAKKLKVRAVNAVEPAVPQWLRWSEQTITWSCADHPPRVDDPGQLALVVAPQVGGYTLNKVLMDGGSSINILDRKSVV